VRKVVYDSMEKEELELFNPLIEAAMKGLRKLKDKYSFDEAWWKFRNFLYVSHILLSSEHPYDEILLALEWETPNVFGSYALDWHRKFWKYPVEKIFGLRYYDEVRDEEEEEKEEEIDWEVAIEEEKKYTPWDETAPGIE
jgi:DNA polymerase IIIc chi subunit